MEKRHKSFIGQVVSNKMQKTVVVAVETRSPHPKYKRIVRHRKKFKAHDGESACSLGDVVRIEGARPLSREKRWRVVEILSKGKVPEVKPKEIEAPPLEVVASPLAASPESVERKDDPDVQSPESSG